MINKNSLKNFISYIGIFTVFFSLFLIWHLTSKNLTGYDDPYYHAGHSALIAKLGVWSLPNTWVAYQYPVDAYVLAHFLAAKFISIWGTIIGIKIFASVQAALIFVAFFWLLKRQKINYPIIWTTIFALASGQFFIRLLFERPFVLSIAILMFGYGLMREKKYWQLSILSIFYILYYNLAPIIILLAFSSLIIDIIRKESINLRPLIATLAGITAGILIHPLRDNYIWHMSVHFFWVIWAKINGLNLNSGAEIQRQTIGNFFEHNLLLLLLVIFAYSGLIFLYRNQKITRDIQWLTIISLPWIVLSIWIPRGVEYGVPFGCLLAATIYQELNKIVFIQIIQARLIKIPYQKLLIALTIFVIFIINSIAFVTGGSLFHNQVSSRGLTNLSNANIYLKNNTPQNSIIFYPTWDLFPLMFFFNTHNRYIMGFDPAFLYVYNPDMYWTHHNLSQNGIYCSRQTCHPLPDKQNAHAAALAMHNLFQSDYIIVGVKPNKLLNLLESNEKYFNLVYENSTAKIFRLVLPDKQNHK